MERHRTVHDIIAIGVLKGVGGEQQFRILRILRIISFFRDQSTHRTNRTNRER